MNQLERLQLQQRDLISRQNVQNSINDTSARVAQMYNQTSLVRQNNTDSVNFMINGNNNATTLQTQALRNQGNYDTTNLTTRSNAQVQSIRNSGNLAVQRSQNFGNLDRQESANAGQLQNTMLKGQFSASELATTIAGNFKNTGLSAGLGLASGLIQTGVNYLSAKSLLSQQAELQRQNFDYMTNKAENAYTSSGLPSWLAFSGGAGAQAFPHQSQAVNGSNFFTSSLPGNTSQLAWTGSQSQLALGVGNIPQAE